ncbi:uncharacterized protein RJT21DRAFT_47819 [Scheffersomyces amazonensis]|uniref:uncharacterized protein n=1 Tax=Scheffersomyces amazonensis TaxID=1078765 RepID=UPI00315D07FA
MHVSTSAYYLISNHMIKYGYGTILVVVIILFQTNRSLINFITIIFVSSQTLLNLFQYLGNRGNIIHDAQISEKKLIMIMKQQIQGPGQLSHRSSEHSIWIIVLGRCRHG